MPSLLPVSNQRVFLYILLVVGFCALEEQVTRSVQAAPAPAKWVSSNSNASGPPDLSISLPFVVEPNIDKNKISKRGCNSKCGNVLIPYPFGMDTINCYRDPSFKITCDDSHIPSVASLHTGDGQYVIVHLTLDYVRIIMPVPVICDSNHINHTWSSGPFLHGTPFTVSYTRNKLTVLGCNVYGDIRPIVPVADETTHSGCASLCENVNGSQDCNTAIPKGLQQYYIQTVQLNPGNDHIKNSCIRAFLVDHNFSGVHNSRTSREDFSVPVILDWAIRDLPSCEEAKQNSSSYACGANTICLDSQNGRGYSCRCQIGYEGNPYLGCKDVDECKDSHNCKDAACFNTPGAYYCICPAGRKPETISEGKLGCTPDKRNHFIVLLVLAGIGVSILIIVLLGTSYSLYTKLVRRKKMKMKQRQFQRNDGLLLKQKITTNDGRVEKTEEFE